MTARRNGSGGSAGSCSVLRASSAKRRLTVGFAVSRRNPFFFDIEFEAIVLSDGLRLKLVARYHELDRAHVFELHDKAIVLTLKGVTTPSRISGSWWILRCCAPIRRSRI
jgi:hypothetical protein